MKTKTTTSVWTFLAVTGTTVVLLTGCAMAPSSSLQTSSTQATASSEVPDPEPTGTADPDAKVAFVDSGPGAPVVNRPGSKPRAERLPARPAAFTAPASYTNGISVTTSAFRRGKVTSEGSGIITGAPYIVFDLALNNGSKKAVDVSAVVVTLKYGASATAAAPLYDDVPAVDFSGSVAPGETQTSTYAFQLPANVGTAVLYVDINGALLPAKFEGGLPQ